MAFVHLLSSLPSFILNCHMLAKSSGSYLPDLLLWVCPQGVINNPRKTQVLMISSKCWETSEAAAMGFWGLNSHVPNLWAQSPVIIGGQFSHSLLVGRCHLFYFLILFSQNKNERTPAVNWGTLHLGETGRFLAPPTPKTFSSRPGPSSLTEMVSALPLSVVHAPEALAVLLNINLKSISL